MMTSRKTLNDMSTRRHSQLLNSITRSSTLHQTSDEDADKENGCLPRIETKQNLSKHPCMVQSGQISLGSFVGSVFETQTPRAAARQSRKSGKSNFGLNAKSATHQKSKSTTSRVGIQIRRMPVSQTSVTKLTKNRRSIFDEESKNGRLSSQESG